MKKLIIMLVLILSTSITYSQTDGAVNLFVTCDADNIIRDGQHVYIDTLFFESSILLMQDNSTMKIRNIVGTGRIIRGGIGGAPTINGIDRYPTHAPPNITLIGCELKFNSLTIDEEKIQTINILNNCDEEQEQN